MIVRTMIFSCGSDSHHSTKDAIATAHIGTFAWTASMDTLLGYLLKKVLEAQKMYG